jgi:hypothetical protein
LSAALDSDLCSLIVAIQGLSSDAMRNRRQAVFDLILRILPAKVVRSVLAAPTKGAPTRRVLTS